MELRGDTILDKRRDAQSELDDVRRLLVNEPRGHADMYGCFVTEPEDEGADLGVVFFHNAGYSTACGHGTIALVTWALEAGVLPVDGRRDARRRRRSVRPARDGRARPRRRRRVGALPQRPSYVWGTDVAAGSRRRVRRRVLRVASRSGSEPSELPRLIVRGRELKRELEPSTTSCIRSSRSCATSTASSSGSARGREACSATSPSSPTARSTARRAGAARPRGLRCSTRPGELRARRRAAPPQHRRQRVPRARRRRDGGRGKPAVITEVEGSAHLTGEHHFVLEDEDELGTGFLLR